MLTLVVQGTRDHILFLIRASNSVCMACFQDGDLIALEKEVGSTGGDGVREAEKILGFKELVRARVVMGC